MNKLVENKLFVPAVLAVVSLLFFLLCNKIMVEKVADRVIQKLQRDYAPSPFAPGFDPDKIDSNRFKK